jgi:hypothetical protein
MICAVHKMVLYDDQIKEHVARMVTYVDPYWKRDGKMPLHLFWWEANSKMHQFFQH